MFFLKEEIKACNKENREDLANKNYISIALTEEYKNAIVVMLHQINMGMFDVEE